ncbi:MAG: dockerin type I repeat-containing protein [Clostridia bacterium]|nr:dockerin type I repeat-containing protein [Clostridia bacterium]
MKKIISVLLTVLMLSAIFVTTVSAEKECNIHVDQNLDDYCDACNVYALSAAPGLNATAVITENVLVVVVYNYGVKSFDNADTSIKYNPDKLMFYDSQHTDDSNILFAGADHGDFVVGSFISVDTKTTFAEDEPFILYTVTFVITDENFTVEDIPTITVESSYDFKMYSGSEYKANPVICFDTTHLHIDEDMDRACDICTVPVVYIGDMNNDGNITAADARIALRIAAKLQTVTEYELFVGDLNGDGLITAAEARKILRVAAHIDSF